VDEFLCSGMGREGLYETFFARARIAAMAEARRASRTSTPSCRSSDGTANPSGVTLVVSSRFDLWTGLTEIGAFH
jgi:hypothetical protein